MRLVLSSLFRYLRYQFLSLSTETTYSRLPLDLRASSKRASILSQGREYRTLISDPSKEWRHTAIDT